MFNEITALGYGLVTFALIIGVGSVVLYNFGGATGCSNTLFFFNSTQGNCSAVNGNGTSIALSGTAYTNTNYLLGQLGQSGLAGWTPAIIAISVGLLFLGAFMVKSGNKTRY
jgi:hypothetical protein